MSSLSGLFKLNQDTITVFGVEEYHGSPMCTNLE